MISPADAVNVRLSLAVSKPTRATLPVSTVTFNSVAFVDSSVNASMLVLSVVIVSVRPLKLSRVYVAGPAASIVNVRSVSV